MIIEATYLGPYFRVKIPGYEHKLVERGQTVTLRIPEGQFIGGCWKIVKGKTKYNEGLKAAEKKRKEKAAKIKKHRETMKEQENKRRDAIIDAAHATKPDKKG